MQLALGFFLAALAAYAAYRARSLNHSGALTATLLGTIIFGLGGWQWAALLLAFFITSSGLSRAFKEKKKNLNEKFDKGSERDAGQVFGNGGVAAFFIGLHLLLPQSSLAWIGFAAALAAVNADTWATELGVLNPRPPRIITNPFKIVEKGSSGGISLYGTLAALAGAALIGGLAFLLEPNASPKIFFIVSIAGLLGALFDSLLGATLQAMYFCPRDKKETEKHPLHTCGEKTIPLRGWRWLTNDWVNFACAAFGAIAALALTLMV